MFRSDDMTAESLAYEGIEQDQEGQTMFDENYYARTGWNLNLLPHMKVSETCITNVRLSRVIYNLHATNLHRS